MPAPRIVIEQFPNDLIREFHVNERISSEKLYDSLPGADALKYRISEVTPPTIQTALSFYEIEGVTSVSLDIYEVRITISPAFDWDEITPQVIDRIKKHLLWDDVEVRSRDSRPAYGYGRPPSDLGDLSDFGLDESSQSEE